jgi:hypothetical protein
MMPGWLVDPQGTDFPVGWRLARHRRPIHPSARRLARLVDP